MSVPLPLLSFLLAGVATAALAARLARRRPPALGGPEGRAAPDSWRAGAVATAACAAGAGLVTSGTGLAGMAAGLCLLALAAVALIAMDPGYEVVWTSDGLEGPSALWLPPFGPKRDFLLWRSLRRIGRDALGNRFIEDEAGNRVRWNWLYAGAGHLLARLETVRPDLFDDEDDDFSRDDDIAA